MRYCRINKPLSAHIPCMIIYLFVIKYAEWMSEVTCRLRGQSVAIWKTQANLSILSVHLQV